MGTYFFSWTNLTLLRASAARSMAAGPQTLDTAIQAVLPTKVTQVAEVAEAGPHGPLPVAVKKSLIVPQVVKVMVCGGMATAE